MSRHRFIPTAALAALAVATMLFVAGCGSSDGGGSGSGGGTATTAGGGDGYGGGGGATTTSGAAAGGGSGETTLTAQGLKWSTNTLSLPKGSTTLKVVNADTVEHSFTADSIGVDQDIEGGEDANITLDLSNASGSIPFHCKYHPRTMTGTIEVTG